METFPSYCEDMDFSWAKYDQRLYTHGIFVNTFIFIQIVRDVAWDRARSSYHPGDLPTYDSLLQIAVLRYNKLLRSGFLSA